MKRKLFLLLALTLIISLLFTGCSANKGDNGDMGASGLSAYEIYCKHYIYIESEKQWIDDLVDGKLEKTDNSVLEEKIYWAGNINNDFSDNEVLLVTDKYFSEKEFTIQDFHMLEVEKVKLISNNSKDNEPGHQIYLITIKNKGK